jgi:hypothetical protein
MSKRITPQQKGKPDDYYTPIEALDPLYPHINKQSIIWEPACGRNNITNHLLNIGYKVVSTDITNGYDFFQYQPDEWDISITNPPYSIKTEWLRRAYMLGKPFALLCPYTFLEGKERQALFNEYGIEIIFVNKRYNFIKSDCNENKSTSWFPTAWFCYKFNIGKQISFYDTSKNNNG